MKKIIIVILILMICGCFESQDPSKKGNKSYRYQEYIHTDEGLQTTCIKVEVEGKEYFRCDVYNQYYILCPVVK